jgi:hypothetical protein
MAQLRRQGQTLDQIARRYNLSRERVRQLLGTEAAPDSDEVARARRDGDERQALAHVEELLGLWRDGRSPSGAASVLGLRAAASRRAIATYATDGDRTLRRAILASAHARGRTYSDADILRAIQRVADDLGRTPHAKEYGARARELGCPSLPTVLNRMGGWTAALQAAGLTAPRAPQTRARRWTDDACWAALRRVARELDTVPTVAGYDRHARDRDDLPSAATIRNRLGRWSTISARLVAERDGGGADERRRRA